MPDVKPPAHSSDNHSVPADSKPTLLVHPRQGTPDLIDTPEGLASAVRALAASHMPVAVDVERAHGFRYSARAYLIQIRREDVGTFLIDADALPQLADLNEALSNAVWILHAADQDLPSLRQAQLNPTELFDTEVAAQLLGYERCGLAAVSEEILGITLDKNHQASDWSLRPLPRSWLRYAALDVELLTDLYRVLGRQLYDQGRWQWAMEEFEHSLTRPAPTFNNERWRSLPGAGKIRHRRQLAILKELWQTREDIARETDIAPTRFISNRLLVSLAYKPPRNKRSMLAIQQMRSPRTRKYSDQWLKAINRGRNLPEPQLPQSRTELPLNELLKSAGWRHASTQQRARHALVCKAVKGHASALGIDPNVLLEGRIQRLIAYDDIAWQGSDLDEYLKRIGARPWQIEILHDSLERAVKRFNTE